MMASSGRSIHNAAKIAARPSAYATGIPSRQRTQKLPIRMSMSMAAYSVLICEMASSEGPSNSFEVHSRSMTNSAVINPPIGTGR